MSKKDGPTIILDLNFISDDQSILDFINESVAWAKKLDEIVGGISLRLIRRDYTTAQFMWAGKLFIELTPSVVIGRESWQYFRDLVSKTIGQFHCNGAPKAEVWERAFKPNLYLAINREKWRLEKLGQDICAIKNPEINEKSSQ